MLLTWVLMARFFTNFILLLFYLLTFWLLIHSSCQRKIELFFLGFISGTFSIIIVYVIYTLPYIREIASHIIEEISKITIIFLFLRWNKTSDRFVKDRTLILWYGVIVGLFFAFLENYFYINMSVEVMLKRGLISWPMHMLYTVCSTYGLIQNQVYRKNEEWLLLIPVSILIHFLFNQFIAPIIP
jgi:hypothetical protein